MASVELRHVSKAFPGGVEALHEVSLEIAAGELFVLLGPNGSGKTTLLRLIAGLEHATTGEIRIADQVVDRLPPHQRQVGMLFQGCVLYPHLTARQNVEFGGNGTDGSWKDRIARWIRNLWHAEDSTNDSRVFRDRVRDAAHVLGIEDLLDRYPRQLSGGERQRVALGRALVRRTAVFLLDEPWTNIDVRLRQRLRFELRNWRQRYGSTMILVTHDHAEALADADRVAVIRRGRIEQVGTPHDLIHHPRTRFVAEFVGYPPMNFLTGHWHSTAADSTAADSTAADCTAADSTAERSRFTSGDWEMNWSGHPQGLTGSARRSVPAWLGFRADAVRLRHVRPDGGNAWEGEVVGGQRLVGEQYVLVRINRAPGQPVADDAIVAKVSAGATSQLGDRVWLSLESPQVYLFDQQTENNLSLGLEAKPK